MGDKSMPGNNFKDTEKYGSDREITSHTVTPWRNTMFHMPRQTEFFALNHTLTVFFFHHGVFMTPLLCYALRRYFNDTMKRTRQDYKAEELILR